MEQWETVRAWKLRSLPDPPVYSLSQLLSKLSEDGPLSYRTPQPGWETKAKIRLRDKFTCALCPAGLLTTVDGVERWRRRDGATLHRPPDASTAAAAGRLLEVHHVVPRANGGPNALHNLVTLCPDCHRDVHDYRVDRIPRNETRSVLGVVADGGDASR